MDSWILFRECWNGSMGQRLQRQAAEKTADIRPDKHDYVPWILINGVSTRSMQTLQTSLLPLICHWYRNSPLVPVACDVYTKPDKKLCVS